MINPFTEGNNRTKNRLNEIVKSANTADNLSRRLKREILNRIPRRQGGSDIRLAYCRANAGTGSTIVCYLDEDLTSPPQDPSPTEITVHCNLYEAGTNLNGCAPLLADGDMMLVFNDGTYWRSLTTFIPTDTCL